MERIRDDIKISICNIKGDIAKYINKKSKNDIFTILTIIWDDVDDNIQLYISLAIKDVLYNSLIQKGIIKWKI